MAEIALISYFFIIFAPELCILDNNNKHKYMNFVQELKWRGMIQDMMPGTEEQLQKEMTAAYLGIDPTADSLHIGHLVGVMMLRHFQRCGHKPYALIGGATGMIGDPSGKSKERVQIDEVTLRHNQECIRKQLAKFLDFDSDAPNHAELVNNYDWMKDFTFLDFIRNIGKLITVNYMMSKDSVKRRFTGENGADGMSFTEFTYQLLQGYDFLYLNEHQNCKLQLGGADQWGNITTGTELIRKVTGNDAFALTCPLITKADGKKFGKTESGNVWLDPKRTSPYKFYQFWLNVTDEDAKRYIRIFTSLDRETIEALEKEQEEAPHLRALQKRLAQEITIMVHSQEDYETAVKASNLLFSNGGADELKAFDETTLLQIFESVPNFTVAKADFEANGKAVDILAKGFGISNGEFRKLAQGGGIAVNKQKLAAFDQQFTADDLLFGKYLVAQKGKKNYYLVTVE